MEEPVVPGEEHFERTPAVDADSAEYPCAVIPGGPEMDEIPIGPPKQKLSNVLPFHGNPATMNLNPLVLNNIQSSHYFKVELYSKKTYHEVIDEMYYHVKHLEPWEKGSRKTAGQTGMCGGVRGVGAGGIVSTAFCILYKLYTLKLTRKQVNGLINYEGAPHVRAIGLMYIRYTQPPADLWTWFEPYLEDEEEVDVRAGGGHPMTVGQIVRSFLTKLDWFSTLFPRIPVPISKDILAKLKEHDEKMRAERVKANEEEEEERKKERAVAVKEDEERDREKRKRDADRDHRSRDRDHRSRDRDHRSRDRDRDHAGKSRSRERDRHRRDKSRDRDERRSREKGRDSHRSRSADRARDHAHGKRHRDENDLRRGGSRDHGKERRSRDRDRSRERVKHSKRSRSRSRDRERERRRH